MPEIRLNVLKNDIAPHVLIADAKNFKKIPIEKIGKFLEWDYETRDNRTPLTDEDFEKAAKKFNLGKGQNVYSAARLAQLFVIPGAEVTKTELKSDLEALGFKENSITAILAAVEKLWTKIEPVLKRNRLEALPELNSLRWRVDVRYASSNYLRKPEAVAIIRIGTNDREKKNHVHFELDLDKLSWLESIVIKVKSELLKAQERIDKGKD